MWASAALGSRRTWVVGIFLQDHLGPVTHAQELTPSLFMSGQKYILTHTKVWPPGGTGAHSLIPRGVRSPTGVCL